MTNIEWLQRELLAGRIVSTPIAIRERGWWRLAAGVQVLRSEGWPIADVRGPHGVAAYVLCGMPYTFLAQQLPLPLFAV